MFFFNLNNINKIRNIVLFSIFFKQYKMEQHYNQSFLSQCRDIRQEMELIPIIKVIEDQLNCISFLNEKIICLEYDKSNINEIEMRDTLFKELVAINDTITLNAYL